MANVQAFEAVQIVDWSASDSVKSIVRERMQRVTQTKIVEDSMREGRSACQRQNFGQTIAGNRAWAVLVQSKLESEQHHFSTLGHAGQEVPSGLINASTHHLCNMRLRDKADHLRQWYKKNLHVVNGAPPKPQPVAYGARSGRRSLDSPLCSRGTFWRTLLTRAKVHWQD